ncbi:hypothetical protein PLICRDRAFT_38160 [Plicaturopsis crispa FD-325 SS-3]|nr:hypothetical protein PLICRDRAFT_38160 [Plicaturopsis crispa FD-325 SS-3]
MDDGKPDKISKRFFAADSDVTLRSRDKVRFLVHHRNVSATSESLAALEIQSVLKGDVTDLPESSEVLDILLQYMYPQRQPDLQSVSMSILKEVAEAAEKYEVFSAMEIAKLHMRKRLSTPGGPVWDILDYSTKHGYAEIMDEAARKAMENKSQCAKPREIPSAVAPVWLQFQLAWLHALSSVLHSPGDQWKQTHRLSNSKQAEHCGGWSKYYAEMASRIGGAPAELTNVESYFLAISRPEECAKCCAAIDRWKTRTAAFVAGIPTFSSIVEVYKAAVHD